MNTEQLISLCNAGHTAPSADNSQPWRFIIEPNCIYIIYDKSRVTGKTFAADSIATLLSMGGVIAAIKRTCDENSLHYSLDTTLTPDKDTTQYACFTFDEEVSEKFTLSKDASIYCRHTNRFAYKTQQLDYSVIKSLINESLPNRNINIQLINENSSIKSISTLIKSASEIRFQTPEIHAWLMQSLRFGKRLQQEDGLHISTLDLPPMGGSFMKFIAPWSRTNTLNKLGMFKLMAGIEAQPIAKAPGLIAISCANNADTQLQAGIALFNLWLSLNIAGLAVHPYFVITDQIQRLHDNTVPTRLISQAKALQERAHAVFNLSNNESLCMLLRVGYPKKQAVRSKRLDCMDLITLNT